MANVAVNIRMPEDMTAWIDEKVEVGYFADRSHAVRFIIGDYMARQGGPKTVILEDGVVTARIEYYGDAEMVGMKVL